MILPRKTHIIRLFNEGYFKLSDAEFYHQLGFDIICRCGKVIDIVNSSE